MNEQSYTSLIKLLRGKKKLERWPPKKKKRKKKRDWKIKIKKKEKRKKKRKKVRGRVRKLIYSLSLSVLPFSHTISPIRNTSPLPPPPSASPPKQ